MKNRLLAQATGGAQVLQSDRSLPQVLNSADYHRSPSYNQAHVGTSLPTFNFEGSCTKMSVCTPTSSWDWTPVYEGMQSLPTLVGTPKGYLAHKILGSETGSVSPY